VHDILTWAPYPLGCSSQTFCLDRVLTLKLRPRRLVPDTRTLYTTNKYVEPRGILEALDLFGLGFRHLWSNLLPSVVIFQLQHTCWPLEQGASRWAAAFALGW
jgi:hypothetical protein